MIICINIEIYTGDLTESDQRRPNIMRNDENTKYGITGGIMKCPRKVDCAYQNFEKMANRPES